MTMTDRMEGAALEFRLSVEFLTDVRQAALRRLHELGQLREARERELESLREARESVATDEASRARALDAMYRSIALVADVADDELEQDRLAMLWRAVAR
jgi:hypothetical protein